VVESVASASSHHELKLVVPAPRTTLVADWFFGGFDPEEDKSTLFTDEILGHALFRP
jgi:hypothetical protein